jgi:hypothetical protein
MTSSPFDFPADDETDRHSGNEPSGLPWPLLAVAAVLLCVLSAAITLLVTKPVPMVAKADPSKGAPPATARADAVPLPQDPAPKKTVALPAPSPVPFFREPPDPRTWNQKAKSRLLAFADEVDVYAKLATQTPPASPKELQSQIYQVMFAFDSLPQFSAEHPQLQHSQYSLAKRFADGTARAVLRDETQLIQAGNPSQIQGRFQPPSTMLIRRSIEAIPED